MLARLAADGVPPSVATMREALTVVDAAERDALRSKFHERLPLAFIFASAEEKAARAEAAKAAPAPEGKTDV